MQILGACGIVCTSCPAYIAGRTGDRALQEKTAADWKAAYGVESKAEDVVCDGCQPGGQRLFAHCTECPVRACAQGRHYATCAECNTYDTCPTIHAFFASCPDAKPVLDGLRQK